MEQNVHLEMFNLNQLRDDLFYLAGAAARRLSSLMVKQVITPKEAMQRLQALAALIAEAEKLGFD